MPKFATLVSLVFLGLFASGLSPVHAASSGYAVTDVNLRNGPGVRYRVKAVIPRRARITIYRCRIRWCRVSWRGMGGGHRADMWPLPERTDRVGASTDHLSMIHSMVRRESIIHAAVV